MTASGAGVAPFAPQRSIGCGSTRGASSASPAGPKAVTQTLPPPGGDFTTTVPPSCPIHEAASLDAPTISTLPVGPHGGDETCITGNAAPETWLGRPELAAISSA